VAILQAGQKRVSPAIQLLKQLVTDGDSSEVLCTNNERTFLKGWSAPEKALEQLSLEQNSQVSTNFFY
jgi:hypothetical protein